MKIQIQLIIDNDKRCSVAIISRVFTAAIDDQMPSNNSNKKKKKRTTTTIKIIKWVYIRRVAACLPSAALLLNTRCLVFFFTLTFVFTFLSSWLALPLQVFAGVDADKFMCDCWNNIISVEWNVSKQCPPTPRFHVNIMKIYFSFLLLFFLVLFIFI